MKRAGTRVNGAMERWHLEYTLGEDGRMIIHRYHRDDDGDDYGEYASPTVGLEGAVKFIQLHRRRWRGDYNVHAMDVIGTYTVANPAPIENYERGDSRSFQAAQVRRIIQAELTKGEGTRWVKGTHGVKWELYYRNSNGSRFDIADITCEPDGTGFFKNVLLPVLEEELYLHGFRELHVVDILTDKFMNFFIRRNWTKADYDSYKIILRR